MNYNLNFFITILPYAFALHNLEEVISMGKWTKSIPKSIHQEVTTGQFAIAVGLFTLLGFVVILAKNFFPTREIYFLFVSGFAGMLFLNTFFPHLIATIYLKKYAPGIVTALLINLPLSIFILNSIHKLQILNIQQISLSVLFGGLIGVVLAYLFLKVGYFFTTKRWK